MTPTSTITIARSRRAAAGPRRCSPSTYGGSESGRPWCCAPRREERARQLERLIPALDPVEVRIERGLYGASSEDLMQELRAVPDDAESVMLVGHQPAIQELALDLAGKGLSSSG